MMVGQDTNSSDFSDNPYAHSSANAPNDRVGNRPSGITKVSVIVIVLGVLGAFGGLAGMVGPMMGKAIQQKIIAAAEANPESAELQMQADLQKKTMAVGDKFATANMVVGAVMLIACLALVVAAILALQGSSMGRGMLATMCLLILFCDLGKTILQVVQQREMMSEMEGAMSGMMQDDGEIQDEDAAKAEEIIGFAMKFGAIIGLVIGAAWFLLKAIFYIYASRYLNRPDVRSYYDAQAAGA